MIAEIIAAGSEMLTPFRQDTNSLYLTDGLNDLGVQVAFKTIVGDNLAHLTSAALIALSRADIVIFSGGLGPTEDDLTREAVAAALGIGVHPDNAILTALYKRFAARQMIMPPNNAKQADVLDGATVLDNKNGSAPAQYLDTTVLDTNGKPIRKIVILLPGPPKELKPLFDNEVKPRLAASLPIRHLAKRILRMALIPESHVDSRTAPIYQQYTDVETTILAGAGEIELHFKSIAPTQDAAQRRVDEVAGVVEDELDDAVYSRNGESLEQIVGYWLQMRNATAAVAESCTGGLLSERITSIGGSSRYFLGGAVVYSNALKTELAGVPAEMIDRHGAVSREVAAALAEGIRYRCESTLGVGITGVAGPGGGTPDKPVGLVFHAVASSTGTEVLQRNFPGDRKRIRRFASTMALDMVRKKLM